MMRAGRIFGVLILALAGVWFGGLSARAGTIYDSQYVSFSPDRQAWTTDAGNQNMKWYAQDGSDDVVTGLQSSLEELQTGQHYYQVWRTGSIPIARWRVYFSKANCCHNAYPKTQDYHGVKFVRETCLREHFSGWRPICADCGQVIVHCNFYMSKGAARSLSYLQVGEGIYYYYLCPFNRNLEQGTELAGHTCKAVSANRYRVTYHANAAGEVYGGYMAPSFHMYGNATEYEGREVTAQTHLNKNTYTRIGWQFTGWNTAPDGSGLSYRDEAEIFNLCAQDYQGGDYEEVQEGTIRLYAMWRPSECTLEVDPAGGAYDGSYGITSLHGNYGTSCEIAADKVTAPAGSLVTFDTCGGERLNAIRGTRHFVEWKQKTPFLGKLQDHSYSFCAPDGNTDRITAVYERDAVTLPQPTKTNQSFGGWYYDAAFQKPAGGAGDKIIPSEDLTLYAQWVELVLTAEDNYTDNGGQGAVDLSWSQPDGGSKSYKLYQSRDGESWEQIFAADDVSSGKKFEEIYSDPGVEGKCVIPYTGFYNLEAGGAQGGSYSEYSGGLGGVISGKFWLRQGEELHVGVGGQDGTRGGGTGSNYGNGGGYSVVEKNGGILLLAGGGGGAGLLENGYPGGSSQSLVESGHSGENGAAGGGGGYLGGHAGEAEIHNHVEGVCNHVHIGDSSQSGGCYTVAVQCGLTLQHVYTGTEKWYWGGSDESYCPNCGTDDCKGHERDNYKHVCPVHGVQSRNHQAKSPKICKKTGGYAVGCGKTEEYTCGYPYDGYIISAKPSYGGSSYVDSSLALIHEETAGVRTGNGYVKVTANDIGYLLDRTQLSGVPARDMAAPDEILLSEVEKIPIKEDAVRVQWPQKADNGTVYYHKAESYLLGSETRLSVSNITVNTLISGLKGYLYRLDHSRYTEVNAVNGALVSSPKLQVTLTGAEQYLHIAAVDFAGNISETCHISLGSKTQSDQDIQWPIFTRQLSLESGDNVYLSGSSKVYYVKSDGTTPFRVKFEAYMKGAASESYQINYGILEGTGKAADTARNLVYVPSDAIGDSTLKISANRLGFSTEDEGFIKNGSYVMAIRSNRSKSLAIEQELLLDRDAHAKKLCLVPIAGADYKGQVVYSGYQADKSNALWIIGDGEPPEINGLESLDDLPLLDRRQRNLSLFVTAADELSGVRELYLEIENLDNGATQQYFADGNGVIALNICQDVPIFSGDFQVTAYACDNVGNERSITYGTTEFDLQAQIERVLAPHEPQFKGGESGYLRITSWGYAEKIEILFPEEFSALDETLNHVYTYELTPAYRQEETYEFMIPLYVPQSTGYEVTVRAYKGDKMLEQHPALAVLGVEGTVLDELRTRLR